MQIKVCFYFLEWAIGMLKRKIYSMLRSESSKDWPHFLKLALAALNNRHVKSIGGIRPSEIQSNLDDYKIREAQRKNHIFPYKEPNYLEQNKNQKSYLNDPKKKLQLGTYVLIDVEPSRFRKSFHLQVTKHNISN